MSQIDPRTVRDLQFDRILNTVAGCCRTERGRDIVLRQGPMARVEDARAALALVEEAARLLDLDGVECLEPVPAMDIAIAQAVKGGVLGNEELIAFARLLKVAGAVRAYVGNARLRAPGLAGVFESTKGVDAVAERIENTFAEDGTIRDDASPTLADLRAKVRTISRRVKTAVEDMLKDTQTRNFVQDEYFTLREGRYVLPVKAEDYRFIPGIIHGTSQTGHTFFVEPSRVVDDNNALTVATDEIAIEENAIRADRTRLIARFSGDIIELCDALWRFDSIVGRGAFLKRYGGMDAAAPELVTGRAAMVLKGAVNPVLALQAGRKVVPIDLDVTRDGHQPDVGYAVIISGPNAGGKSVTLSTVGLCCLLVRHGIVPPVGEGSKIPWYDNVLTVIGDPADMDRAVSNFTGQLARVEEILQARGGRTLVLIDELATGTEPSKGEALATAIVEHMVDHGDECLVATHYDLLKRKAGDDGRFVNVRVGVDRQTGLPTYRIEHGEVGESNPFQVARSVGFPEKILARAVEMTGQRERQLEQALEKANALNAELLAERVATTELKTRLTEEKKKYTDELVRLRKESDRLVYQARQDVLRKMKDLEEELERIGKEARAEKAEAARREQMVIRRREEVRVKKDAVVKDIQAEAELLGDIPGEKLDPAEIKVGQKVYVVKLRAEGVVTDVASGGRKIGVQVGLLKTAVKPEDLRKPEPKKAGAAAKQMTGKERDRLIKSQPSASKNPIVELHAAEVDYMFVRSPTNTVDVRGMRVDEAIEAVDKHLDTAMLNEEPQVMIIHGMGTSALRKAIRERLLKSRYVKSCRSGERDEGGEGVSIVEMA